MQKKDDDNLTNDTLNEKQLKEKLKWQKIEQKKSKKIKKLQAKYEKREEQKKLMENKEINKKQQTVTLGDMHNPEQPGFLEFAFSILISAAVAYLLGVLVSDVPIENSTHWLYFSIIIVMSTVGLIYIILGSIPKDKYSILKTLLIITSTMAIFGFARFYSFYTQLKNPELAVTQNSMGVNYFTFVGFFFMSGIILLIQGIMELMDKSLLNNKIARPSLLIFSGIIIIIIVTGFLIFLPLGGLMK
jgi:hypothetical protein